MRADRARLDRTHGCPLRLRGVDVGVGRAIAGQLGAGSVQVERRTVPVRRNTCAVPAEQSQPVAGREVPGSRRAGEGVRRRLRIAHHADALQRAPPHLIQSPDVPAVGGAAEQCQRPGGVAAHGTAVIFHSASRSMDSGCPSVAPRSSHATASLSSMGTIFPVR